jgi:guanine deaminase
MRSTPLIDFRMDHARDFMDQLFIQMTLGDDRAVQATYVAGRLAYCRPDGKKQAAGRMATPGIV